MIAFILAILMTLILVVGIHEAGHALVARIFGIGIQKISIGFGRPILRWRSKRGCDWVWGIWPLGGYVQLLNSRISPVDPEEYPFCFDKKTVWIRILVLLAGGTANLIVAWLAFVFVFYMGIGYTLPQVQSVQKNSISARAGIEKGDQFIAIDGIPTPSWREVGTELVILWGQKQIDVTLKTVKNKQLKKIHLDLSQSIFSSSQKSLLIGLGIIPDLSAPAQIMRCGSLLEAMHYTNQTMGHTVYFFLIMLKQLVTGVIPFSVLLGPLGVFAASVSSFTQGLVFFLFFIAQFSLAVALINFFPIPGLDGGSILYGVIELIRGKPISIALEVLLHRLIVIVFALLLVHLLMNDLNRFITY